MAQSLAHRWGQIIGDVFETFVRGILGVPAEEDGTLVAKEVMEAIHSHARNPRHRASLLMRTKVGKALRLSLLALILILVVTLKTEPVVDWVMSHELQRESDPIKRIVLMNMTLEKSPDFWNRQYLNEALRADTEIERAYIADLVHDRYTKNAVREMEELLAARGTGSSASNVAAIIRRLTSVDARTRVRETGALPKN